MIKIDRIRWMPTLPIVAVGLVYLIIYYVTHPFPANRGGLFLVMARQLSSNSFLLPSVIGEYTITDPPFAYPPIGIYIISSLISLGIPELLVLRTLPGLIFIVASIGVYAFVTVHMENWYYGVVAGILTLVSPQVISQTFVGAGVPRSLGILFVFFGLIWVQKTFETPSTNRKNRIVAGIFFGVCLLTHYVYTLMFITATILMFILNRRTKDGFQAGLEIALMGFLVASPWLIFVGYEHGLRTLFAPGNTWKGGVTPVPLQFLYRLLNQGISPVGYIYTAGALVGSWYLILQKKYFLPALALVYGIVYPGKSLYVVFSILTSIGLVEFAIHGKNLADVTQEIKWIKFVGVVLALGYFIILGGAYIASPVDEVGSPPEPLNHHSMDVMRWANNNTEQGSIFLFADRSGEWFPAFAHRRIAVTPWGTEWEDPKTRKYHQDIFRKARYCETPSCYKNVSRNMKKAPDYLVIRTSGSSLNEFRDSAQFSIAYGNSQFAIISVDSNVRLPKNTRRGSQ